jgi:hypothetical protein
MADVDRNGVASGAITVQTVYSSWRGSRRIEHLGSAH